MEPVTGQTIYPEFGWDAFALVVALVFVGVALLGTELFVVPGFGVVGVLGIAAMVAGTVTSWIFLGPTWGALVVVSTVVLSTVLLVVALKTGVVKRRLVLSSSLKRGGGTQAEDLSALLGAVGEARSDLRPAGIAAIGDARRDVVSEGGFIEKGTRVEVVGVDGPRVVVAPAKEE